MIFIACQLGCDYKIYSVGFVMFFLGYFRIFVMKKTENIFGQLCLLCTLFMLLILTVVGCCTVKGTCTAGSVCVTRASGVAGDDSDVSGGVSCDNGDVGCTERPLIGITTVYKLNNKGKNKDRFASAVVSYSYIKAVADNGGAAVLIPDVNDEQALRQYINRLDGLVLIGGDDVPPEAYGQTARKEVRTMPRQRFECEKKLIAAWLNTGKPVLGVCLGMQFTNVVRGGSLIQDIPAQVGKTVAHRKKYHHVRIAADSMLAGILNARTASVYSSHHQAVKDMGRGLRPIAWADDGVVEAAERTDAGWGLFLQWHPERMKDVKHRDAVFRAFILQAYKQRNSQTRPTRSKKPAGLKKQKQKGRVL